MQLARTSSCWQESTVQSLARWWNEVPSCSQTNLHWNHPAAVWGNTEQLSQSLPWTKGLNIFRDFALPWDGESILPVWIYIWINKIFRAWDLKKIIISSIIQLFLSNMVCFRVALDKQMNNETGVILLKQKEMKWRQKHWEMRQAPTVNAFSNVQHFLKPS